MPSLTGNSRADEVQSYDRMLGVITAKYEPRIYLEIARAMRQAGKQYADPLGNNNWRQKHVDNIGRILLAEWTESGKAHTARLANNAKSMREGMERKDRDWQELVDPTLVNGAIADWVSLNGAAHITEITSTTASDINTIIAQAEVEGLSEKEAGRLIYEIAPSKSAGRAQTIARTEAHGVGQSVSLDVAKSTGAILEKVWIANESSRTRSAHIKADGQRVPLDGAFIVDGERLDYPGDSSGSAGNVINCRCTVGYEVA